jgi:hypothetical protein
MQRVITGAALASSIALLCASSPAFATEGALGRPVAGTSVTPNAGIVPPAPIWAANLTQLYLDGSIGGGRSVPIAGQIAVGIEAEVSFTLATLLKVWDTGTGAWNFASSITVPYVWTRATATLGVGAAERSAQQSTSNLFDLYFTPILAGYHFSKTEHLALSSEPCSRSATTRGPPRKNSTGSWGTTGQQVPS